MKEDAKEVQNLLTGSEAVINMEDNKAYSKNEMTKETKEKLLQTHSNSSNNELDNKPKTFNLLWNKYFWIFLACSITVAIVIAVGSAVLISQKIEADKKTRRIISELTQMTYLTKVSKLFDIIQHENLVVIKAVLENKNVTKNVIVTDISNGRQKSLLHVAVEYRDYDVVEYLMINQRFSTVLFTYKFKDSLIQACMEGIHKVSEKRFEEKTRILQLLFKTKPELIESRWGRFNMTPLQFTAFIMFQNGGKLELIKMLIQRKANLRASDNDGDTPLHLTVRKKPLTSETIDVIKLLIQNNADPDATNFNEKPFLYFSIEDCKSPTIFNQIVKYLASINKTKSFNYKNSNGESLLHSAISYFEPLDETLQLFKSNGVDFNAVDNTCKSALDFIIYYDRSAKLNNSLILFGADRKIQNRKCVRQLQNYKKS